MILAYFRFIKIALTVALGEFAEGDDVSFVRPLLRDPFAEGEAEEGGHAQQNGQHQTTSERHRQRRVRVGRPASGAASRRQLRQGETPPGGQKKGQQH